MRSLSYIVILLATITVSHAEMIVTPFSPLFKGVEHAVGTNFPTTTVTNNGVVFSDYALQVVHCLKVDLAEPTLQLFATPRATNYSSPGRETLSLTVSNFVKKFGVSVATDANFYDVGGVSDPGSEGIGATVHGLLICTGQVVSASDNSGRYASLLFTTNKTPIIDLHNLPPGTNTSGIFTAVTGFYPVLTNGVNVWALYYNDFSNLYPDGSIHDFQPRTAFGVSQDRRFLFMMTIDGRQFGYSDGALDAETAMWMLRFGAWDAINMDGGGSTAMYMADCRGDPVPLNHSSYPLTISPPRERIIGAHFGVHAQPLPSFIHNLDAIPAMTTANITWTTDGPASSQVEYGTNRSYGTLSVDDPTPVTSHRLTLTGLKPGTRYFYRVLSSDGTSQYSSDCTGPFVTTNNQAVGLIFDLTKAWKYSTAKLDGTNWQAPDYQDSGWSNGLGVLWTDSSNPSGNPAITNLPLNTQMSLDPSTTYPFITYYFRTHFTFTNSLAGVTLTFSNYIDDGAAFYLNGVEIDRFLLASGALNATLASGFPCAGNATCPHVFTISGTNLQSGDNVVAVEVHNVGAHSPDITFGQALLYTGPPPPAPPFINNLTVIPGEDSATFTWMTISNSTSRVAYSPTTNINKATPVDTNLVTSHSVTVTGLSNLTFYYFRVISSWTNAMQFASNGTVSTVPFYAGLVALTNTWSYTTNNENGIKWQARNYDESLFLAQGRALLYIENNPAVSPLGALLPAASGGEPFPTYYFRTHFSFDTNLPGFALVFTNYIDDGAIFYLNGTEIQRVRMPPAPQPVLYNTFATDCPHPIDCDAVTNAPDVFRISGDMMTNLLMGVENVLAVEVHQRNPSGSDVVFGSGMGLVRALVSETRLRVAFSGNIATVSWDGAGFSLQQAQALAGSNSWSDVTGPIRTSPYSVTNPLATTFFRLKN